MWLSGVAGKSGVWRNGQGSAGHDWTGHSAKVANHFPSGSQTVQSLVAPVSRICSAAFRTRIAVVYEAQRAAHGGGKVFLRELLLASRCITWRRRYREEAEAEAEAASRQQQASHCIRRPFVQRADWPLAPPYRRTRLAGINHASCVRVHTRAIRRDSTIPYAC